jgi:hypothetical protein
VVGTWVKIWIREEIILRERGLKGGVLRGFYVAHCERGWGWVFWGTILVSEALVVIVSWKLWWE